MVRAFDLDVPARLAGPLVQQAARGGRDPFIGTAVHDQQGPRRYRRHYICHPGPAVDLGLLLVPLVVWMVAEARRIGVRFVWLYVIGGMLIAISVTFPLFMIARERQLAAAPRAGETPALGAVDTAGLVAFGGMMAGVALGAAAERIPVVADGFISTSATALACVFCQTVRDYLFIGHRSRERGHNSLIEFIGHRPLLDLQMRLGEGTGAALAMGIITAAARLLSEMATFAEAGVSDKEA